MSIHKFIIIPKLCLPQEGMHISRVCLVRIRFGLEDVMFQLHREEDNTYNVALTFALAEELRKKFDLNPTIRRFGHRLMTINDLLNVVLNTAPHVVAIRLRIFRLFNKLLDREKLTARFVSSQLRTDKRRMHALITRACYNPREIQQIYAVLQTYVRTYPALDFSPMRANAHWNKFLSEL